MVVAVILKREAFFICLASLLPGSGLIVSWISTCRQQAQLYASAAFQSESSVSTQTAEGSPAAQLWQAKGKSQVEGCCSFYLIEKQPGGTYCCEH